ncbi:MAG TPA: phosphotransferase [Pedococcus sp.]|nr:phosphotransferase [Pedococcus sp.]
MAGLFSEVVAGRAWQQRAHEWISVQLAGSGRVLQGEIEQRRIRPWSTQLVAPTDQGPAWFKANCAALAFEPAVHAVLARLVPDEVDSPLAVDGARGWMMTSDRGITLGERRAPTLEDWQALLRLAATLQRRVMGSGERLAGAGLPDCGPETVLARYRWLVQQLSELPPGHPSHLGADEARSLASTTTPIAAAVEALSSAALPVTFQHGDLHPKNVFEVDSGVRLFDFGDAQWAHALEILAVPYAWVTQRTDLPWSEVLDAYASCWSDVVSRAQLDQLLPSAMVTHAVNRSFTWLGALQGARPDELAEWGDAPAYYLRQAHAVRADAP